MRARYSISPEVKQRVEETLTLVDHGWTDGRMDGWIDRDGWMDGWMDDGWVGQTGQRLESSLLEI